MPSALTFEERHHPAKYSSTVLDTIRCLMDDWGVTGRVLDPYAGVGWIHRLSQLDRPTFAVEIENPWAANQGHAGRTVQGDAGSMGFFADGTFTAIACSAVYMNRMRDHHDARDSSKRMTYKHQLAELTPEPMHKQNMGAMTNDQYRKAAQTHIREFRRVLIPGGLGFLNLSNAIDGGIETNCVEQWLNWLTLADCRIREMVPVATRRLGFGANHDARVEHEVVIVAEFPPARAQGALL